MSSKKSPGLNSSSIEWFVRKLSCPACPAFFAFSFLSFLSSKEIKSSSSSNLSTINSMSSSSSSSYTDFSRRGFFFLSFFSCSVSHIWLILILLTWTRLMKLIDELAFTLNILAATALLSVRFSLKNFFAFFIPTMVMMKMEFILTRKRDLFWSEKRIDNQSENQITAIITATNDVSEDNIYQIGYMNQFQSNKWWFSMMMMMINLINDWFWWFSRAHRLLSAHRFPRLKSERFLVGSH